MNRTVSPFLFVPSLSAMRNAPVVSSSPPSRSTCSMHSGGSSVSASDGNCDSGRSTAPSRSCPALSAPLLQCSTHSTLYSSGDMKPIGTARTALVDVKP